jgi:2-hydroxychromene-2-carboxylate isomerase
MPTIDYYISLNSPWTYLGSARFAAIAKKYDCTVNVKPDRQNRWLTPGEAGTRAPCLSAHGSQTLARPPRHSDQYRTEVLSLG